MSEEPTSDGSFEEILKGMSEDIEVDPESMDLSTVWACINSTFSAHSDGILVKGIVILEVMGPDGKYLHLETSPELAPWDKYGLMKWAENNAHAEDIVQQVFGSGKCDDEDCENCAGDEDED
jgi:hypothetical protein